MQYDPYKKYTSNDVLTTELLIDDWECSLVDPDTPSLRRRASINPFSGNIDWTEREAEMIRLMHDKLGVGLAAPQIGSGFRMFVMTHSVLGNIGVYNPKILETEGNVLIEEGCLTWPLLYVTINRPERIKVTYTKTDGVTQVETWMDGMDARCFMHEYDHLEGTVFFSHVSDFKLQRAKKQREKLFKKLRKLTK